MKRSLVVLLTIAFLLFAFAGMAVAATAQEDAADRLFDLGFIEGYPDGTLGLDRTITRAEFAKVAVIAAGFEDAAALLQNSPSQFGDVATGLWYTGWINVAASQGYVKGYPDGNFQPNDQITAAEVVTVLLRLLGYNDNLPGAWPTNYLVKASGLGITSGIAFDANAPIERGKVFQMLSKTLDENVVEYDHEYALGFKERVWSDGTKTLLEYALGLDKIKGWVTDIPRVDAADDTIEIDYETYEVMVAVDYEWLYGAYVVAYADGDEIMSVRVDNSECTMMWDAIEVEDEEVTLIGADKTYKNWADDYVINIDEEIDAEYDYAKVVINKKGEIAFIEAFNWDFYMYVEEVDDDIVYAYGDELDAEDYVVVKAGKTIAMEDIEAGDMLFVNEGEEYAEVYTVSADGEIGNIFTSFFEFGGKEHKFANDSGLGVDYLDADDDIEKFDADVAEDMKDEGPITAFVDRKGDAVFILGDTGEGVKSSFHAYVYQTTELFYDRTTPMWTLDVVTEMGTVVGYDVKQTDALDYNAAWPTEVVAGTVVKITLKSDGKIDKVELANQQEPAFVTIDEGQSYIGGKRLNAGGIVFVIEDAIKSTTTAMSNDTSDANYNPNFIGQIGDDYYYIDDEDDIVVMKYSEVDFDISAHELVLNADENQVIAIVAWITSMDADEEDYDAIATGASAKVSGEDIWRLKLVIDNWASGTYFTEDGVYGIEWDAPAKGDFLEITINENNNEITYAAAADSDRVVYGEVTGRSTRDNKIWIDGYEYILDTNAVVFDDEIKVASLRDVEIGDYVKVLLVADNSDYVKYVVEIDELPAR